jgi:hypothetical protein
VANYPFGLLTAETVTKVGPSGDTTGATDTATIQAALTAGGLTVLAAGVFWINQTLQFPTGSALAGQGMGITTVRARNSFAASQVGSNGGMVMLAGTGNTARNHITVASLTLDMNEQNTASVPGYAIAALCSPVGFQNITALTITQVEVINAIGYSMFPLSCADVTITGCRVITGQTSSGYANQDGIHVTDCTGTVLAGNYITTGSTSGVGDDAIAVQGVSTGCLDTAITGNVIEGAAAHGIGLYLGGAVVTGVTITGNTVTSTFAEGLILGFNTFVASATYLISDVVVTGNTFRNIATGNAASGITLQDAFGGLGTHAGTPGYSGVTITGNLLDGFTNTTGFGIYAQAGSDLTLNGNTIRNWKALRGIDIGDNSSATSRTVTGCSVSGNIVDMTTTTATAPFGICVVDSPGVIVTDNTISGAAGPIAASTGVGLLAIGTAITGANVGDNRVQTWALAIGEANDGAAPDFNIYVGNNCHGNTAFITTVGTHDVVASNVVA